MRNAAASTERCERAGVFTVPLSKPIARQRFFVTDCLSHGPSYRGYSRMRGAHGSERKNCLSRSGVHKPLPIEHANSRDEAIQEELGDFGNCQDRAFPRMG